jgi:hypothetical protein
MLMSGTLGNFVGKIIDADKGEQLFLGFIFIGLLVKIGLGFAAAATALLWGYFIMIFAIIGLILLRVDINKNNTSALKLLFEPLLLLILVLLWNISLNLRFFDEINTQSVPTQYFMWSWFSTILIISIVTVSVLGYIQKDNLFTFYGYILLVFNLIVTAVQQIVLECFTVDG